MVMMTANRKIRLAFLAGGIAALIAGTMPALGAGADFGPDPILDARLKSIPKVRPWPLSWFEPRGVVKGTLPAPLLRGTGAEFDANKLAEAADWAAARESQAFLVWHDGKLVAEHYGKGAGPATLLSPYYMHQTALVLLYGIAVAEGKIPSIDLPASTWLTEWKDDARAKITVRHLLQMAAGLETYHDSSDPAKKETRLFFGGNREPYALAFPAVGEPGKVFAYSYAIPELLGLILKRATGKDYVAYASEKLWKPLGNGNAEVWLDRKGGTPLFNGALFATAEDWLRVGLLILNKGMADGRQLVPASWIETMITPSAANPGYGMIWLAKPFRPVRTLAEGVAYSVKAKEPFLAEDMIIVDGYGGQRVYIMPGQKMVIVRIGPPRRDDWDDSYLPNQLIRALKAN